MSKKLFIGIIAGAVFLSGCAGSTFVKTADEQLVLGKTTESEIIQRMGNPYREGVVTKNEKQMKALSYSYANVGGEASAPGVTAAKSQGFYFFQNKLAGHEFVSSWKEDSTDFDEKKIEQIEKLVSTRSNVIDVMGVPGGKYAYPLVQNQDDEAMVYLYNQAKGSAFNMKFYSKLLLVSINKQGVVTNVEYTSSGEK